MAELTPNEVEVTVTAQAPDVAPSGTVTDTLPGVCAPSDEATVPQKTTCETSAAPHVPASTTVFPPASGPLSGVAEVKVGTEQREQATNERERHVGCARPL